MTVAAGGVEETLMAAAWLALLGVTAAMTALLVVVAARRFSGGWMLRRSASRSSRVRPLLLSLLADDEPDEGLLRELAAVPDRDWRALEPTVVNLLGKVRGGARQALVDLLEQRQTLARATRRTRSWSVVERCRGAETLGAARREDAVRRLGELLEERSPEVRQVATRSLGRVGSAQAVGPLLGAIRSHHGVPARDVAAALTLLEPAATGAIIAQAGRSTDPSVRAVAAEALGLRGAVAAADLLVAMLESDEALEVRIRAARALGRVGARAGTAPLIRALAAPAGELRAVAARALGQLGAGDAVEPLVELLGDPSHRVAANAAESLAALGPAGLGALRAAAEVGMSRAAAYAREALAVHELGRRPLERLGS